MRCALSEAIARHMSFARAAEELHVTPAALSHQIRGLEEQLGLPLFTRRTRSIELTEAGARSIPACMPASRAWARRGRGGSIASATPTFSSSARRVGLTAKWLMPRLWRFLHAHPEIDARVVRR
jgi:LysR family glycine cleavage system transcriptional activator